MWGRLTVGRPLAKNPRKDWEWSYHADPMRFPTVAWTWASVDVFTTASMGRYKSYINELDTLTHHQVIDLLNLLFSMLTSVRLFKNLIAFQMLSRSNGGRTVSSANFL